MASAKSKSTLAYDDAGSGPAVLLIHGYPLCRKMWQPQFKALTAAGYRVIAPDLRGFGESVAPSGSVSMVTYADDIVGLMDYLGIGKAVIGGMSMGGYVLFNLLERYPGRLAGACFIVTRAGADDEPGKMRRSALAREVASGKLQAVPDAFAGIVFAGETERQRPELVARVRGWMESTPPQGLIGGLLAMRERKDYSAALENIRLPVLVIGAEADRAIAPEHSRAIAAAIPGAHLVILPRVGHLANLEDPAGFNARLLEFLGGLRV